MALMNETSSNATRSTIQIFVAAPYREVGPPVVQAQRDISNCVGEIESDDASLPLPSSRDFRDVEKLAGRVIHSAQQNERNRFPFAVNE
jgi:hypothetical protein